MSGRIVGRHVHPSLLQQLTELHSSVTHGDRLAAGSLSRNFGKEHAMTAGIDHTDAERKALAELRGLGLEDVIPRPMKYDTPVGELRTLIGCVWHIFRRRCVNGVVLTAHSSGRAVEALGERW